MRVQKTLLLCTNGAPAGLPALEYGSWLAHLIQLPVTVLGIVEDKRGEPAVKEALESTQAGLHAGGIRSTLRTVRGDFLQVLIQETSPEQHLVVLGPLGRPPLRKWLRGASFRHIAHELQAPVLYASERRSRLRHVLVCLGGLGYARSAEQWALFLAKMADARMTLLHVVEPISYAYPTSLEIQSHIGEILSTDTPQGKCLREALQMAQDTGVETAFHERQGDIIHEILAEIKEGDYDLVAMGSPESSTSLRQRYKPNVTAEIAEKVSVPVLAVRLGQELSFA